MSYSFAGSHWESAVGVGTAGCFLSTVSVCARLYTRYFVTRSVGIDDVMAIASLLATIGASTSMSMYAIWYMRGVVQVWTLADRKNFLLLFWLNELLYNIGTLFIKWTYLFQYLRIFRKVRAMLIAYWICIVLVGVWYCYQIFGFIFNCKPISGFWDKTSETNCNVASTWASFSSSFFYINAGGTLLVDMIVLLLPVPTIWNLKLHFRQKLAIFGIFAVGGIVPIITAGRISSLSNKTLGGVVNSGIWSLVELCAGIITAALATIRLHVSRHLPVFGAKAPTTDFGLVRHQTFNTFGSRRANSSGSQRDLVRGDECEMQGSSSTGHSSIDIRKDDRFSAPHITWRESADEALRNSKSQDPNLQGTTEGLHFGLPAAAARMGVKTTITSNRERSLAVSGVEFLSTFGILVEHDWEVTESVAV